MGISDSSAPVSVTVAPSTTYYAVVDGASNARGTFTISATCW
jgi:hypothetical protein